MATKQQTTPTNGSQEPQVPVGGTILAEGDILYN
jgi:hypothetical protein